LILDSLPRLSAVLLAKEYKINRNTADKIISLLETNNWVRRIPRKGTFPVKQSAQGINSINIIYDFNSFNQEFLNSYPYANAKLIESIYKSELANQCNINILLIAPAGTDSQILEKLSASGPRAGFIVLNPQPFPLLISLLRREKMPYITFGPEADMNQVTHDSYHSACRAVEHLIKVAHRKRIAFMNSGGLLTNPWTAPRFNAYSDTLRKNGIPFKEQYIFSAQITDENIVEFINSNVHGKGIDAIFASSFEVGRRTVNILKLKGIKIPEEVAVIVFYDLPEFSLSTPTITAIRVPLEKMGHAILEKLIDMINFGFRDDIRITFSNELVLRESC